MQEFWATAKLHHNSIRFKIDTKKSVLDLEAFREMLHISHKIPNQSFAELPSEKEILDFLSFRLSQAQMLWGIYHRINIDFAYLIWEDFVYQVEHKNQKRSNEMYYPRFTKVIIDYFMTRKPSISKRNRINWHYVRDDVLFSTIKVAGARKKKGDSASSTTPPTPTPTTTVVSAPRLSATAKGKQPARATTPTEPTDVQRTEAEQLKIVLKRSRQETHISQQRGSGTDKGTSSRPGVPDVPSDDLEEELSWNSSEDEDVGGHDEGDKSDESDDERDEGSDDDSDETVKAGSAFRFDERLRSLETSLSEYRQTNSFFDAVSTITGIVHQYMTQQITEAVREAVQIQTDRLQDSLQRENDEFLRNIDENMKKIIKGQVKNQVKEQVSRILPRIEESVNATHEAEVLTRSSHSSRTSYAIAADLSEMELKKILIEKMKGNKSI
nr:hypothetical protein [Tanacetum cinerariifolium]